MLRITPLLLIASLLGIFACTPKHSIKQDYIITELDPDSAVVLAQKIRERISVTMPEGMELSLWASDSLAPDPISLFMDRQGRAYITRAVRQTNSEFDIRGHMEWATASVSWETVEDRRAFLHEELSPDSSDKNTWLPDLNGDSLHDWRDLTVERDEIIRIEDRNEDGFADYSQVYVQGDYEEITDVAGTVLVHENEVFYASGPDLNRLTDRTGDGVADTKESISHGYNVHVGFGAHGMSGLTVGPDGRIYWSAGDIGTHVVDKTGKRWKYPNQGTILRANPDGSDFEVFAAGLRNTHEFVFDPYGNIISVDNDGDHPGEMERLVYVFNGSDAGWRINWQFGKYTDPDNNAYKVWMDEELFKPRWEGQAAYINPPIMNYHSGPTGMKYNPGTALGSHWKDKFFIVEFTGSPTRSRLFAFTLNPKGAGFEFGEEEEVLQGILPTGISFGPDGALYLADWIEGWGTKDYGRIWKLDIPSEAGQGMRKSVHELLASDFSQIPIEELANLLGHEDKRVRQEAQFSLVKKGSAGEKALLAKANNEDNQIARIHALWGLWQIARGEKTKGENLLPFLEDSDVEIRSQATKILGDIRYQKAADQILPLLKDSSLRQQFFATEALGRMGHKEAVRPIMDMLIANDDQDITLRHAGAIALARIGDAEALAAAADHESRALRITAVVALRRMRHAGVAKFLKDEDPFIVTEAARAINDDWSIEAALPTLAEILDVPGYTQEPLIRRAINANSRVGEEEQVQRLIRYTQNPEVPAPLRAEALATLAVWAKPSVLDRVDGRYRGEVERDASAVVKGLDPVIDEMLLHDEPAISIAAMKAVSTLGISAEKTLMAILKGSNPKEIRMAALEALYGSGAEQLESAIRFALASSDKELRSAALAFVPKLKVSDAKKVELLGGVLANGSIEHQQSALASLGKLPIEHTKELFDELLDQLEKGILAPALKLELEEAIKHVGSENLHKRLDTFIQQEAKKDPLGPYRLALEGGDAQRGLRVMYQNQAAQCFRCHKVGPYGGDVGPELTNIGTILNREEILASLVLPSARVAPGYALVSITLRTGEKVAGTLISENSREIILRTEDAEPLKLGKSQVEKRIDAPSSMPPMGAILKPRELRDIVAALVSLDGKRAF